MSVSLSQKKSHLANLFHAQNGRCRICDEPAVLDGRGGEAGSVTSAVRFRIGSAFGAKGRRRPRVMVHRGCAQKRAADIEASQPIEELWRRAGSEPDLYSIPGKA